jgi:hypothetical protein
MFKRLLPYGLVILITLVLVEAFHPLAALRTLAQGGCRTFPETKQTVCGEFLTYWDEHGGLAQQGYPISGEFSELSDLDGKSYTVQYFERAVFEKHPENRPPYNVLLSQLGTYWYNHKYKSASDCCNLIAFDAKPSGTNFNLGDTYSEAGTNMKFVDFFWSNGATSPPGIAYIDNKQESGGTGQDLRLNNITIDFAFASAAHKVTMNFGDFGGNENLTVNGALVNFTDFSKLHGTSVGGVNISVTIISTGTSAVKGLLTLSGTINQLSIGGQELFIDSVCSE